MNSLQSLIQSGTKLWLDSVDPKAIAQNRQWGATGATSNPIIVRDLIETGQFDDPLRRMIAEEPDDSAVAWRMTDLIVRQAQETFRPVWQDTAGNDGYVSFELDPLIEDPQVDLPVAERTKRYIELGKKWSAGHSNRMIKVPNTTAGVAALEELTAAGVPLNVTLTFTARQYLEARDAVWRGAQRRGSLEKLKSVYSIFVSRIDVYSAKHLPDLSAAAQGQIGIVNAKRIWQMNEQFWADKKLPLQQEIIFASTGVKMKGDDPWKYVAAFAGSGIETNPPETNDAAQSSGRTFECQVHQLPPKTVLDEIDRQLDVEHMEQTLMREGIQKFADPQKALLESIAKRRKRLAT